LTSHQTTIIITSPLPTTNPSTPKAAVRLADSLASYLTALTLGGADTRDTQAVGAAGAAGAGGAFPGASGGAEGGQPAAAAAVDPDIDAFDKAVEGIGEESDEKADRRAVPPSYKVGGGWGWLGRACGGGQGSVHDAHPTLLCCNPPTHLPQSPPNTNRSSTQWAAGCGTLCTTQWQVLLLLCPRLVVQARYR